MKDPVLRRIGIGTFKTTPRIRALVNQVLESGQLSYGPLSLEFEQRFAGIHGCQYGILSNSGTSSLQVALQALKEIHRWESGQVILPATTFVATANIVTHNRMVPVFVDVDPKTYNLDPLLVARYVTPDTRVVLPVHLFGQPADMTRLQAVVHSLPHQADLKFIEDSCETMFAKHNGLMVGGHGDIACFSMYVAHLLVSGVGGIATTNNPDYAAKMRSLVNHGLSLDNLNPGANFSPQPMMGRRFVFDSVGHSFRITEFEAACALAQLDDVRQMLNLRRGHARHLTTRLEAANQQYGKHFRTPYIAPENEHSFMMYPVVLEGKARGRKAELTAHLNKLGIETRDMLPLLNQPVFKYLNWRDYPVSADLIENGFYVGIHQGLLISDITYLAEAFALWIDSDFQAQTVYGVSGFPDDHNSR